MPKLVLAFGHKRERGKTTAALIAKHYLIEKNIKSRIDSFAFSIKEGLGKAVFGMSDGQLYGRLKNEFDTFWKFTPRWMMQYCGTEMFRNHISMDIWAKTLERRVFNNPSVSVIVDDLRFKTELDAVKRLDGYFIKCNRDIAYDPKQDDHQSERDLDHWLDWDYVIDNNHSVTYLEEQVKRMIDDILNQQTKQLEIK